MEQYTGFSAHASLVLIAEWTKSNHIWEELRARVHIRQKTIRHSPSDKLKDLLINMWAGGERISSINNVLRTDEGLQRLFGRTSCAEQSTVSETLKAISAKNIVRATLGLTVLYLLYREYLLPKGAANKPVNIRIEIPNALRYLVIDFLVMIIAFWASIQVLHLIWYFKRYVRKQVVSKLR